MFSNKQNINILTSLLMQHGVGHAIVCPGSRNAAIVQNLRAAGIQCHPVTDERSAAFYALGMSLGSNQPVAVCVTSGSAVLNLLPGIAEAAYQHIPVIAITADRPAERIGQLDGQTLPQPKALSPYVAASVDIPEPHDTDTHIHCNRLINEALLAATRFPGNPVQINIRLSEPLMDCAIPRLPKERKISEVCCGLADPEIAATAIYERMAQAKRPMVIVGQSPRSQSLTSALVFLSANVPVLYEALASNFGGVRFDGVLEKYADWPSLKPDFVLYAGETIVSKRLKRFIEGIPYCETWAISADGAVHDTFKKQTGVIHGDAAQILSRLVNKSMELKPDKEYVGTWKKLLEEPAPRAHDNSAETVATFEHKLLQSAKSQPYVHYANSTAVRLANIYARHYVYVNRGLNGIEGSLSTAAGHSRATDEQVYCVIGDLSFFYDSNALWNGDLRGNLRILLINNGKGEIFDTLPGMPEDVDGRRAIMGNHKATAQGICASYDIVYDCVTESSELSDKLDWLIGAPTSSPTLLEIDLK